MNGTVTRFPCRVTSSFAFGRGECLDTFPRVVSATELRLPSHGSDAFNFISNTRTGCRTCDTWLFCDAVINNLARLAYVFVVLSRTILNRAERNNRVNKFRANFRCDAALKQQLSTQCEVACLRGHRGLDHSSPISLSIFSSFGTSSGLFSSQN